MLECAITSVSQDLDLEKNVTLTFLVIRLPNGVLLRAAVDEETASQVIAMQVAARGAPQSVVATPQRPAPPPVEPPVDDDFVAAPREAEDDPPPASGDGLHIFGGQDASTAPPPVPPRPPQAAAPAADDELPEDADGSPTVVLAEEPPAPKKNARARSRMQRLPSGKLVVPSMTVPAALGGYPNVPGAGVDTNELTGGRDPDEDGIGSV